jgi:hypothetical protein
VIALASAPLVLVLQLTFSGTANAAGGTWGAGAYPYVAGKVCTTTDTSGNAVTSPLAAWDLSGGSLATPAGTSALGYLTMALTSDGTTDSGAPPLASVGSQGSFAVAPGFDGFYSDTEIATFARLLSTPASSLDNATAARIAQAVLSRTALPGAVTPNCSGDYQALLNNAASLAGPYKLTLTPPSTPADPGSNATVIASVLAASGRAVPGMVVTYVGPDGASKSAVTDSSGHAQLFVTVTPGTPAATVSMSASVNAPIGLTHVSVTATPTPANPTGVGVAALIPGSAVAVTATATVPVDSRANPAISASGGHTGIALGNAISPQAVISGLRGHRADVGFTIYGPLAIPKNGTCADVTFSNSSPVAAGTSPVTVIGNQTLKASQWAPASIGCYLVAASLTTVDAIPSASAHSSLTDAAATVTVINPVATLTTRGDVLGAGAQHASVSISGSSGGTGTVSATLVGPVAPADDGSCTGVTFDKAPTAATATAAVHGDGTKTLNSSTLTRAGCYLWKGTLSLNVGVGPGGAAQVPIQTPENGLLLLAPSVQLAVARSSTASPDPVQTVITVTGLYDQAAHVRLEMHYARVGSYGCRDVSWRGTSVSQTGPAAALVTVNGVATANASTGQLQSLGCWYPIAVVTIDTNPGVMVKTALNDPDAVISAGLDPNPSHPATNGPTEHDSSWLPAIIAGGVVAALELAISVIVVLMARRTANEPYVLASELIDTSTD